MCVLQLFDVRFWLKNTSGVKNIDTKILQYFIY